MNRFEDSVILHDREIINRAQVSLDVAKTSPYALKHKCSTMRPVFPANLSGPCPCIEKESKFLETLDHLRVLVDDVVRVNHVANDLPYRFTVLADIASREL